MGPRTQAVRALDPPAGIIDFDFTHAIDNRLIQRKNPAGVLLAALIQQRLIRLGRVDFTVPAPGKHRYYGEDPEQHQLDLHRYGWEHQQQETDSRGGKTQPEKDKNRGSKLQYQ